MKTSVECVSETHECTGAEGDSAERAQVEGGQSAEDQTPGV